ncbi:MAG: hypothetical protein ACP5EN_09585 [Rhodovulum sp.]
MFKKTAIFALALGLASPVAASDQIAKEIDVNPGDYTLHEMVQIYTSGGFERGQRVKLIHKEREAFVAAVQEAAARAGVLSTSDSVPAR